MTNLHYRLFYLPLLLALCLLATLARAEDNMPEAAQELIVTRSKALLDGLKKHNGELKQDPSIAYRLVEDIVLPHVDFQRVGRIVLGKYWRRAKPAQREQFVAEFKQFLVRTYVTAMIEFSDQIISHANNVRYLPFRNNDAEDVSVRMEILLPDRPPISVQYSLYKSGNGWQIYDLAVEGISLATTYRSSFASEIRRGGLDRLIDKLAARNRDAANGHKTASSNDAKGS